MARCSDNDRLQRIGCGAEYSGELQHSVARVPWSTFPDGMAHITGRISTINVCWAKGDHGVMADPATVGLIQNEKGHWARPMSVGAKAWIEVKAEARRKAK